MPSAFSDVVMNHFMTPRRAGTLPDPSGEGWSGVLESNRFMRIQVRVEADAVVDATFATYGCAPAIAAGSYLCEWAVGRSVSDIQALTAGQLTAFLGGLPANRRYCADLAVDAFHRALSNAVSKAEEPAP